MGDEKAHMSPPPRCHFTPQERAELEGGFARILAAREAREWAAALKEAFHTLVQATVEAAQQEARTNDQ
ncbi:hypothetical protein ACFY15_03425 [Streptomyces sp. NPDC001373]|uniref:hypothetical protein n=1 Tax=Streptomyces sp. NPDC001373 TaxID=3364565 RepID=UPI003674E70B